MAQPPSPAGRLYPLIFKPIAKERIWGGRNLEKLYGKELPAGAVIGETWEISDRPGDESVIANGPLAGKTLHWLMEQHAADLLGSLRPVPARFPLLLKIIDARQTLSLQVHPPASIAASLGGEPKTEFWYVAQAGPAAELFVGLKNGVTREQFEARLASGTVAECFHRIHVKSGDSMFLPSGRVHALGANVVVFEIQQNSDTTYRVFDWNRVDSNGKPRQLHIPESLASIDFEDFEPSLLARHANGTDAQPVRPMVKDKLFEVVLRELNVGEQLKLADRRMHIVCVIEGSLQIVEGTNQTAVEAGGFCLIPACCSEVSITARQTLIFLQVQIDAH